VYNIEKHKNTVLSFHNLNGIYLTLNSLNNDIINIFIEIDRMELNFNFINIVKVDSTYFYIHNNFHVIQRRKTLNYTNLHLVTKTSSSKNHRHNTQWQTKASINKR
jgi:hypothetical protein